MKKAFILLAVVLTLTLVFTNCSSPKTSEEVVTQPVSTVIDPWFAPVGSAVQGATLNDGWYDLKILDAPVNVTGGWTDSAAISSNGLSLYFAYTRYDFAQLIDSATYLVTGPNRNSMTGNHFKNFRADLTVNGWVVNQLGTPFNSDPNVHESSLSANAAENLIAWSKWDATATKASLYFSIKNPDSTWAAAAQVPSPAQSANCSNDNPFVVGDVSTGVDLYFESDRADLSCTAGGAKRHIYHSYYNPSTGLFSAVDKVAGLNGTQANDEDMQVFVSSDKKQVFWTATRHDSSGNPIDYAIYTADLVGTAYLNSRVVARPNFIPPYTGKLLFVGEANVVELSQGWIIYMICGIAQNESSTTSKGAVLKVCSMKKNKTAGTM